MEEIGARLRAAREGKGISLEVAEEETRIRRKYIEALEEGEVAELPGEVYLKGFLRSYGNYLDLDGAALVEEYKESKQGRRPGSHAAAGDDSAARAARQERAVRRTGAAERTQRSRNGSTRSRPDFQRPQLAVLTDSAVRRRLTSVMLLVVVVAAIGYLGWLIALQLNPDSGTSTPGTTGSGTSGSPTDSTPPVTSPPAKTEPVPTPPPKLPDPPKVTMTRGEGEQVVFTVPAGEITLQWDLGIKERLWVQWWVDEKEVFQGDAVDARGTVRAPAELKGKSMRLRMGHMRGVSLTINGQRFEKPLENGPYTLIIQAK